ncbi:MAG TPA: polysaccharide deacetylase family protein [Pirellulales bacterium]|jgi:O-antigen/teichoic acid export membrane protein/peptidoglycan/xylan/chitin deacetylase (PgdA/CDA1 family)|nr:polysaccharide deacetylase family protein [Pirellulales bacterium]
MNDCDMTPGCLVSERTICKLRTCGLSVYYHATIPYRVWRSARRAATGSSPVMVLFYHRIAATHENPWTTSPRVFERQVAWLKRNFDLVSLEEAQRRIASGENHRPAVSITFDDGYADNCEMALPLLLDSKIPVTYFVASQNVLEGQPFPHDSALGAPLAPNTPDEIRALADAGVEIGCHTRRHTNLGPVRDPHILHEEMIGARHDLETMTGRPVRYFAFPYGHHHNLTTESFALARLSGYRGVCSAYGGYNFPGDNPFHLQRIHPDNDLLHLKNWLTVDPRKLYSVRRFIARPRRAVLYAPDRSAMLTDPNLPAPFVWAESESTSPAIAEVDCEARHEPVPLPEPVTPELLPTLDLAQPVMAASSLGSSSLAVDTLGASVVLMLVMTVLQRLVGFGRGIAFCRWLDPEQLGQWDVAFGFINLAAPLALLGLPGSFGRYFEYYRQRGQVRLFLRRATALCVVSALAALAVVALGRQWFSVLIFGSASEEALVLWLVGCLATVLAYNFLSCIFMAARMYRVATIMQFFQSVGFAAISLALCFGWQAKADSAVVGYGLASALCIVGCYPFLKRVWQATAIELPAAVPQRAFWAKLLPFAAWIWMSNLLSGLFDMIDRYMIVHFSGLEVNEALRQVGYYHTSRLLPLLFVAVSALLGSMITPHLSHDWELGRRREVVARLNTVLKALDLSLFAASVVVLVCAPSLFCTVLGGKFSEGLEQLPLTLVYCTWFGTFAVAQNYLWCAEKAWLSSVALLVGLVVNVSLDLMLLPRIGLHGAVMATTAANFTALTLLYLLNSRLGMRIARGTWILAAVPMLLWCGPIVAGVGLAVVLAISLGTDWLFTDEERHHLLGPAIGIWRTIRARLRRRIGVVPAKAECWQIPAQSNHL